MNDAIEWLLGVGRNDHGDVVISHNRGQLVLTPKQARQMALSLLKLADQVEDGRPFPRSTEKG